MTSIVSALFLAFFSATSIAASDSPLIQGLSGAGRAGVPAEALFTNPASVAFLTQPSSYFFWGKPSVPEFSSGGRVYSMGAYDGGSPNMKGAMGYTSISRARIGGGGQQVYEDRSIVQFSAGRSITDAVSAGVAAKYIVKRNNGDSTKFFQGDAGIIFPLFKDLRFGLTYENFVNKEAIGEEPPAFAAGAQYGLGFGFQLLADGVRYLKGSAKGKNSWSLAAEYTLSSSFTVRGGRFQDRFRDIKGWSLGLSWSGPRASFDYAMRTTSDSPHEKDHVLGIRVLL